MAKPELGTKRACLECSTRYFDLNRDPVTCPKCGAIFEIATQHKTRPANAKPEKAVAEDAPPEPSTVAEKAADDKPAVVEDPDDDTDVAGDAGGEAEIISLDEAEKADGDDDDDDEAVAVLPDDNLIIDDDDDDEVFVKDGDDDDVSDIVAGGDDEDDT